MKRSEFFYDLPEGLIAQHPLPHREDSRLLLVDRAVNSLKDSNFKQLPDLLCPGDLLVFNDSKVIPARLFGTKQSGGRVEILIERLINDQLAIAQVRASKPPKPGSRIFLDVDHTITMVEREGDFFKLKIEGDTNFKYLLEKFGHIPLPPYIKRQDVESDLQRYQTVYAKRPGAVAAPTAGLHFSEDLINRLQNCNINLGYITLHVGAGTFQPVRSESIEDHKMHREWFDINVGLCRQIEETKSQGGRVIAVGTTVVRTLETVAKTGSIKPMSGETGIFIYPGYQFNLIDGLITNFHLPESTLLMLICAFAGKDFIMNAYQHAIKEEYRFYSYGDGMIIL